mgnify:CR=1 FL=1
MLDLGLVGCFDHVCDQSVGINSFGRLLETGESIRSQLTVELKALESGPDTESPLTDLVHLRLCHGQPKGSNALLDKYIL